MTASSSIDLIKTLTRLQARNPPPDELRLHHTSSRGGQGPAVWTCGWDEAAVKTPGELASEVMTYARNEGNALGGIQLFILMATTDDGELIQKISLRTESAEPSAAISGEVSEPMVAHVIKGQEAMQRILFGGVEKLLTQTQAALTAEQAENEKLRDRIKEMFAANEAALSQAQDRAIAAKSAEKRDQRMDKGFDALMRWGPIIAATKFKTDIPPALISALFNPGAQAPAPPAAPGAPAPEAPKLNQEVLTELIGSLTHDQALAFIRCIAPGTIRTIMADMDGASAEALFGLLSSDQVTLITKLGS